jgi:hypothetical protein
MVRSFERIPGVPDSPVPMTADMLLPFVVIEVLLVTGRSTGGSIVRG